MYQLIYMSIPCQPFSPDEIQKLLQQTVPNNKEKGITGILLYKKSNFMQVLEGEESVVKALYAKITADSRHRHVTTLTSEHIKEREFPDWSMAFRDLSHEGQEIKKQFSDLLIPESRNVDPSLYSQRVRSFLKIFMD